MKVVILAGGFGTRLEEETVRIPKPMVHIGDYPILWHIMKTYSTHGFNDFIICLGYKGYVIKEYFHNYFLHHSDLTFDFTNGSNQMCIHNNSVEKWKVTLVDTGLETQTGGRIKRIEPYIEDEHFMLTYGDGVADINLSALADHHTRHGKFATVTAIRPPGKFGILVTNGNPNAPIKAFQEKPAGDGSWINGGYFVLNRAVFDYLDGDGDVWEWEPLQTLAAEGQVMPYYHPGFWQCMDTIRHKRELESMWANGDCPWKVW